MIRVTRRRWLLCFVCMPAALAVSAQPLSVRVDGDFLHIAAPQLQFLSGKTLERLKDGGDVAFLGQISASADGHKTVLARNVARFALSYDIWEERFKVTLLGMSRQSASNLSLANVQTWCLDRLVLNRSQLPASQRFTVRIELRVEDPLDQRGILGESGISLTRMVELFSRPAREKQQHWTIDSEIVMLSASKGGE
jgi:hypothetical protein